MNARTIAFAGSFDPMTHGHVWVIERALAMADHVLVVVAANANKQCWFSPQARAKTIEAIVNERGWSDRVKVMVMVGQYVAPTLKRMGIHHMIRGIRSANDFDSERLLQRVNDEVLHGAQTWFVTPPHDLESVSSSFVKNLIGPVSWPFFVKKLLPTASYRAVLRRVLYKEWLMALGADRPELWAGDAWLTDTPTDSMHPHVQAFVRLLTAYEGADRHHHTADHIANIISELRSQSALIAEALDVSMVFGAFFHDAVHRTFPSYEHWGLKQWTSVADETQSAELVEHLLPSLDVATVKTTCAAIHATMHGKARPETLLSKVMVCSDLAILGQDAPIYDAYARNVRLEYEDVPEATYRAKRAEILSAMLDQANRNELFPLVEWSNVYNEQAIHNLRGERDRLLDETTPLL